MPTKGVMSSRGFLYKRGVPMLLSEALAGILNWMMLKLFACGSPFYQLSHQFSPIFPQHSVLIIIYVETLLHTLNNGHIK